MGFIKDRKGRVPFAVVGVILIFGSIVTSTVINSLEKEYAKGISYALPSEKEKYFIWYVEADLAKALDKAARKALKEIGKTPVTDASSCQVENFKRADNIEPALNAQDKNELATTVNINRARYHALKSLKNYVLLNFYDDSFQIGGYIINVKKIVDKNVEIVVPQNDFLNIEVDIITMNIEDRANHPLGGMESSYHAYMKMGLPVEIEVKNASTGKVVFVNKTKINTLIMNRFLLLEHMTRDFEDNLQTFGNLGIEALASIMLLTWTRGYLQWATSFSGKTMPANIISNQWVAIATTGAILLEEGFVFNAADPLGSLYVGYETADAIFFDITGEHLDSIQEMFKAGKDLTEYIVTNLKSINGVAEKIIGYIKEGKEDLPCSENAIEDFQKALSNRNWQVIETSVSIEELAEDELVKIMNDIDDRIRDVYKADVFIETTRNKIKDNREKIEDEIRQLQEFYENNAKKDMEDEAKAKAEDSSTLSGTVYAVSCDLNSAYTVNERVEEGSWSLIKKDTYLLESGGLDYSNADRVILDEEKWHVNRTRELDFRWDTKAEWTVTVSNGTDSQTISVTTQETHTETKTEWSEENVIVKFISDLYAYGDGDIGKNDIVEPFHQKENVIIYQGEENNGDAVLDDSNLGKLDDVISILEMYKGEKYISWPTDNPFSQTQIEVFEGNIDKDYRMTVVTGMEEGERCFPGEVIKIATQTLQNLKNNIVNKVVVPQEFNASDPIIDPGAFLSETIGELKKEFEKNKDVFIAQSRYMEDGKYISAAAKVICLLRKDYVENISQKLENEKNDARNKIEEAYEKANETQLKRDEAKELKGKVRNRTYSDNVEDAENAKEMQDQEFITKPKTMMLNGEWRERVSLCVHQIPHFLGVDYYNELSEKLDEKKEEKKDKEESKLLETVENPELLEAVTLSYNNINIFSPLAGIDNLIDLGFDALNKVVFDAIDEGFKKIEEELIKLEEGLNITYVDEEGNEITEKYDVLTKEDIENITDKIENVAELLIEGEKDGGKGIVDRISEKIYKKVNEHIWLEKEILSMEEINETINRVLKGNYREKFELLKNESDFNQQIIEELNKKIEEKKNAGEIKEWMAESAKNIIRNEIEEIYKKAVTETIKELKDELKTAFEELSEELSEKLKDKLKEKLEEEIMEKIGDKIMRQIQSTCGGIIPAGLPVLPPFGWWCTINAWVIHVEGDIPYFEVVDTLHFPDENPIFGHEAQSYVRKYDWVWEDTNGDNMGDRIVGLNKPIHFGYTTGSFIVVPPGGTGVGDRVGGFIETEEFKGG